MLLEGSMQIINPKLGNSIAEKKEVVKLLSTVFSDIISRTLDLRSDLVLAAKAQWP